MVHFARLNSTVTVAPQLALADIARAKEAGFQTVINNRPDGEAPDQPSGEAIAAACGAAGLEYIAIPISPGGFTSGQIAAMRAALANSPGPVLAFCRSGTRSSLIWALAEAENGAEPEYLAQCLAEAGYDIAPIRPFLAAEENKAR